LSGVRSPNKRICSKRDRNVQRRGCRADPSLEDVAASGGLLRTRGTYRKRGSGREQGPRRTNLVSVDGRDHEDFKPPAGGRSIGKADGLAVGGTHEDLTN